MKNIDSADIFCRPNDIGNHGLLVVRRSSQTAQS